MIKNIKFLLQTEELVVIADAAMISKDNIEKLTKERIGFVVGARLANLPEVLINSISQGLNKQEGKTITLTYQKQRLICEYSVKRAAKDKSDRLKQLTKAERAISTPSQVARRFRFLKQEGNQLSLSTELVSSAEELEGIKCYLTNTNLPEALKLAGKLLAQKVTNTATGETAYVETTIKDPILKEEINLLRSLGH